MKKKKREYTLEQEQQTIQRVSILGKKNKKMKTILILIIINANKNILTAIALRGYDVTKI